MKFKTVSQSTMKKVTMIGDVKYFIKLQLSQLPV